jgi:hypothetical protein
LELALAVGMDEDGRLSETYPVISMERSDQRGHR